MSTIPVVERLQPEIHEFEASLASNIAKSFFKINKYINIKLYIVSSIASTEIVTKTWAT
jgi:hypothetical protein